MFTPTMFSRGRLLHPPLEHALQHRRAGREDAAVRRPASSLLGRDLAVREAHRGPFHLIVMHFVICMLLIVCLLRIILCIISYYYTML